MCMSPHEMTSREIEEAIAGYDRWLNGPLTDGTRRYWEGRRERFVALLKERAEDGTYDTAGIVDQKSDAYR